MTYFILLFLALLLANSPWLSSRLFFIVPIKHQPKHIGWCLIELATLYFLMGAVARYAEAMSMGNVAPQLWEFYATTACLFLVFILIVHERFYKI